MFTYVWVRESERAARERSVRESALRIKRVLKTNFASSAAAAAARDERAFCYTSVVVVFVIVIVLVACTADRTKLSKLLESLPWNLENLPQIDLISTYTNWFNWFLFFFFVFANLDFLLNFCFQIKSISIFSPACFDITNKNDSQFAHATLSVGVCAYLPSFLYLFLSLSLSGCYSPNFIHYLAAGIIQQAIL